jgi:hypothetical protein
MEASIKVESSMQNDFAAIIQVTRACQQALRQVKYEKLIKQIKKEVVDTRKSFSGLT